MKELQMSLPALLELPERRASARRVAQNALQTCLVVSLSARRAQLLVRAAHEEHWATIVCNSADDALRQSVRQRVQLALVDLQSAPETRVRALKELVEQLAARRMLLAICGKPDDARGEIWSRQLGVWMYLPGVAEARHVLEKMGGRSLKLGASRES
jgi:ActR/RegA family two-component response regulator